MTYQPITLERFDGRRLTVDLAARRGPLAAVRLADEPDNEGDADG